MQPDPATTPESSSNQSFLKEAFERFLADTYLDPPTEEDPHPAVRRQYRQLYTAFLAGCQTGMKPASEVLHLLKDVRDAIGNATAAKGARR